VHSVSLIGYRLFLMHRLHSVFNPLKANIHPMQEQAFPLLYPFTKTFFPEKSILNKRRA
jgi:hypothetical protein